MCGDPYWISRKNSLVAYICTILYNKVIFDNSEALIDLKIK